jgi:hypothetical protein
MLRLIKERIGENILGVVVVALISVILAYMGWSLHFDPELSNKPRLAFLERWVYNFHASTSGPVYIRNADRTDFDVLGIPEFDGGRPKVWVILNAEAEPPLRSNEHVYIYPDGVP